MSTNKRKRSSGTSSLLPEAAVARACRELVPEPYSVDTHAVRLLNKCCAELVHMVTAEALEVSTKAKKKTILPVHIVEGLESLEMPALARVAKDADSAVRAAAKARPARGKKKLKESGKTEEELIAEQQRLFAAARARQQLQQANNDDNKND